MMVSHVPNTHPWSWILSTLTSIANSFFWLVVVCWFANQQLIYATVNFIFIIFALLHLTSQTMRQRFPTHSTPCTPPSLPPLIPTLGWLLCLPFKFRPLKANVPCCLYFLTCVVSRPPNKSPNSGTTKPDHGRLAWGHRRLRHYVLWPPLTYPWKERAKPLEHRAVAAHVGCCVCCVLCLCCVCLHILLLLFS